MDFQIVRKISGVKMIARGRSIKVLKHLKKSYGKGEWRKLKGFTIVKLDDGRYMNVELHWYEAHGIGKKEFKIKRFLQPKGGAS